MAFDKTPGPWFFDYQNGPVIKRHAYDRSGTPVYEILGGDISKLVKVLEIAARATGTKGVVGLGTLGDDATAAYGAATTPVNWD